MFDILHLDLFQLIFDYLSQQDLINFLLINHLFLKHINKYINNNKFLTISSNQELCDAAQNNLTISIIHNKYTDINIDWGLFGACFSNNLFLFNWFINHGANNFNGALLTACNCGNENFVNLLIKKGISNPDWGMYFACKNKHFNICRILANIIKNKICTCYNCDSPIDLH